MAQTRDGALKTFMKRIGIPIDEYRRLCASGLRWCSDCKKMEPVENFGREDMQPCAGWTLLRRADPQKKFKVNWPFSDEIPGEGNEEDRRSGGCEQA